MSDYHQPDFYRFNRDSLELIRFVKSQLLSSDSILDLATGCGVIGIELAIHYRPSRLALLELQQDFSLHIDLNVKDFLPPGIAFEIHFQSFSNWRPKERHDLIVCNPPYYLPGRGELPKDERRGIARSFIKDDWKELLLAIARSLSDEGRAFIVVKQELAIKKAFEAALTGLGLAYKISAYDDLWFLELFRLNEN